MREVYHCDPLTFANCPRDLVELHREFYVMEQKQKGRDDEMQQNRSNQKRKLQELVGK